MVIVAGIDEAGFGPIMGPLVVSAAAFEVPDELVDSPLWPAIAPTVSRRPGRRGSVLAIDDSKKLFHRDRPAALEHLERGVLGLLATRRRRPRSLDGLLGIVAPGAFDARGAYPWYAGADLPLPRCLDATHVGLVANAAGSALAAAGLRLAAMRSEVVLPAEFNRLVRATRNKLATLFDVTSRLLAWLWRKFPDRRLRLYADRHGGRLRYLHPLRRLLPHVDMRVLREDAECSAYRLSDGRRQVEIHFGAGFDAEHLPVALASMLSKYLRELLMELENAFWARHVPHLAPTAGYYVDGKRFLGDIAAAAEALDVDADLLRRCR